MLQVYIYIRIVFLAVNHHQSMILFVCTWQSNISPQLNKGIGIKEPAESR